jgi:hypothetical protein
LAHWTYAPEEWRRYAEVEERKRRGAANARIIGIAIIIVLVCLLSLLFNAGRAGSSLFLITLGVSVLLIIALGSVITFYLWLADPRRIGSPEAWISLDGIYIHGVLTKWQRGESFGEPVAKPPAPGNRRLLLEQVRLTPGEPSLLEFDFSRGAKAGKGSETLRVPVPIGKEQAGGEVLSAFAVHAGTTSA